MLINVKDLIALCHTLDNYSEFNERLREFLKSSIGRSSRIDDLCSFSKDKTFKTGWIVQQFYIMNKDIIDTINKYSTLYSFIHRNYNQLCRMKMTIQFKGLYEYISLHKGKLEKILSVLEKINQLGFSTLVFEENADFTNETYYTSTQFNDNRSIVYLDNMKAIPNYEENIVEYKSTHSNYKIVITPLGFSKIIVNNLLFEPARLPDKQEDMFNEIISLKDDVLDSCASIKNSVDLSMGIDNLNTQMNYTNTVIEQFDSIETKHELQEVLLQLKECLNKLTTINDKYINSIINEDSQITRETLEKAKQLIINKNNN